MKKIISLIIFLSLVGCASLGEKRVKKVKYTYSERLSLVNLCMLGNIEHILKHIATQGQWVGGRYRVWRKSSINWRDLNKELSKTGQSCYEEIDDFIKSKEKEVKPEKKEVSDEDGGKTNRD